MGAEHEKSDLNERVRKTTEYEIGHSTGVQESSVGTMAYLTEKAQEALASQDLKRAAILSGLALKLPSAILRGFPKEETSSE